MKITWLGHACFLVESAAGSLVIDPYDWKTIPGMKPYNVTADKVICTHEHFDHNFREAVTLTGKECGLNVETVLTYHDDRQGTIRGENNVYIISDGEYRVAHTGDLGHSLSKEQIVRIGRLDGLMVNIGGFEASEAEFAASLIRQLRPSLVFPNHFRGDGFGFDGSGTLEEFLDLGWDEIDLERNSLVLKKMEGIHIVKFYQ